VEGEVVGLEEGDVDGTALGMAVGI